MSRRGIPPVSTARLPPCQNPAAVADQPSLTLMRATITETCSAAT